MSGQYVACSFVYLYENFHVWLGIDTHSDCEVAFVILILVNPDHHGFIWVDGLRCLDFVELKKVGDLSDSCGVDRYMHLASSVSQGIYIQQDGLCRSGDVYITCCGYLAVECVSGIFRYVDGFHCIYTYGRIEPHVAQVVPVYASSDPSCSVMIVP